MKFISTLFFLLLYMTSYNQTVIISVKDDQNNIVKDYSIFKNSSFVGKSSDYVFYLNCSQYDTIKVKKDGLISENFLVQTARDTIIQSFTLSPKIQEIEEVQVAYEKYVKLAGDINENLIDFYYYPENNVFLLLKSYKGDFFIEKKTDLNSNNYLLHFKPESLFLDAIGNTHILSKDTAYQIWIQDLTIISKIPRKLFDLKLSPLISKNTNFIFYENYSEHNQCYILSKTDNKNNLSIVSKCFDTVAYKVAKADYDEIIGLYFQETSDLSNIIKNGVWDGNLTRLGETWQLIQKIGWYLQVRSKPIKCQSFGMMNFLILINFYENNIHKYDLSGELINTVPLDRNDIKNKNLIYDFFYDAIYIYGISDGIKEICQLNIENGKLVPVGNLNQIEPNQIKVVGKDVFFLSRNEAGFNKLYRMKIE